MNVVRDILSKSGDSLGTLHVEQVPSLPSNETAQLLTCFSNLERLTIITPPSAAGGHLINVVDMAAAVPMITCT